MGGLRRWGLGRVPAVLLVVVLLFSTIGAAGWALSRQLATLGRELPQYTGAIKAKIAELRRTGRGGVLDRARGAVQDVVGELEKTEQAGSRRQEKPVPVVVQDETPSLLRRLPDLLGRLSAAGLTMLLVVFMLIERQELRDRFIRLAGYGRVTVTTRALDEAGERISQYLLMQSLVNAALGLAFGLGLALLGVPYALLWGVLLALARYIPFVGVWPAAALPTALSLAVFDSWREPLFVVGFFLALELLLSIVVEPVLYSQQAGVSKVALLVAIAFWTWLWGPIGLLLATPLTVCLVVLAKHVPPLDFIGVMLSDEPALEDSLAFYQRLLAMDRAEAAEMLEERLAEAAPVTVYDRVVVPALGHARRDRARGRLSADEERALAAEAGALVEELAPAERWPAGEPTTAPPFSARLLGCAVSDATDEVALQMLGHALNPALFTPEIVPAGLLSAEVVARAADARPAVVCLAALPPGGLARTRYLVKRLRARMPETKILVGRWGAGPEAEEQRRSLLEAGADHVGATLAETRDQLLALLPVLTASEGAASAVPGVATASPSQAAA